ncbi:uncharacterized protein EHS24_001288 [Apiotrichum porosum]|uniref:Uncharacterized protein n=1 Tax=Apiotrichum porosum TaxID=105984 RepID=A0A427XK34_9TREE|nr:uncharacterized protein EHS24_001288 [Apiotrichum porosum]RSH79249.1 hypothetical protein EHS24_001288 [Apiotrichum porosum]
MAGVQHLHQPPPFESLDKLIDGRVTWSLAGLSLYSLAQLALGQLTPIPNLVGLVAWPTIGALHYYKQKVANDRKGAFAAGLLSTPGSPREHEHRTAFIRFTSVVNAAVMVLTAGSLYALDKETAAPFISVIVASVLGSFFVFTVIGQLREGLYNVVQDRDAGTSSRGTDSSDPAPGALGSFFTKWLNKPALHNRVAKFRRFIARPGMWEVVAGALYVCIRRTRGSAVAALMLNVAAVIRQRRKATAAEEFEEDEDIPAAEAGSPTKSRHPLSDYPAMPAKADLLHKEL